jgi:NADH-quinone oxidoreductase subunit M
MLGMFAFNSIGWSGSVLQMLNHGISTGALFLLVGVIYERRHTRLISEFGGLWKVIPVFSVVFLIVMLSSIALPGTNGFVGEFLVLLGAFQTQRPWAIVAATGVILSACYMLWMFQRVVFGPVTNSENSVLKDLTSREVLVFVPLLVLIFWMGLFPNPILSRLGPTIDRQLAQIETRRLHLREVQARQAMSDKGIEPCCPEHGAAAMQMRAKK